MKSILNDIYNWLIIKNEFLIVFYMYDIFKICFKN